MTITGRVPESCGHATTHHGSGRSTGLSHPVGSVDGGVVADKGGNGQMDDLLRQLTERILGIDERLGRLEGLPQFDQQFIGDMRHARKVSLGVMAGLEQLVAVLDLALHRLDHGEDGVTESIIDLRVKTEGTLPRTGGGL